MTPPTDREAPENLQLRKAQGTRHGYRGPAEASAAGSVTCRHSGSCKENRRKRADGLRIKSHTGKIHADAGLVGRGASGRRQGSFSRRANLGQQAAS